MPEQEFLGVDQHPAQVLDGLPEIFCRREVLGGRRQLGGAGVATEGDHVELARDLLGRLAPLGKPGHAAIVVAQLAVDRGPADQLQRLRKIRVAFALAFAGQLAGRPAEGLEERDSPSCRPESAWRGPLAEVHRTMSSWP